MKNEIDHYQLERDIRDYLTRMSWVAKTAVLSQNQKYRIKIYELALERLMQIKQDQK